MTLGTRDIRARAGTFSRHGSFAPGERIDKKILATADVRDIPSRVSAERRCIMARVYESGRLPLPARGVMVYVSLTVMWDCCVPYGRYDANLGLAIAGAATVARRVGCGSGEAFTVDRPGAYPGARERHLRRPEVHLL